MHIHTQVLVADGLRGSSEAVLFKQAQAGCQACLEHLMTCHKRLVPFVVRRQTLGALSFSAAIQAGRIGLWRAIMGYDPQRGYAFSTYAYPAIARHVWQAVKRNERAQRSPPVMAAVQMIERTDPEVIWETTWVYTSLYHLVGRLPERLQRIIIARYGLAGNSPHSYREIGTTLGPTGERVRQLHTEALVWLRHPAHSQYLRALLGRHTLEDDAAAGEGRGDLRYGYRSLALQFAEPLRRFSFVLLDDFLPANAREENPAAALLLQLARFYPDLQVDVVAGDAGLGYYSFLHAAYQRGAKRVVDLRADPSDKLKAQWPIRGYNDKGRPVCPFGYALTSNGFDTDRQRHKWFCGQACLNGTLPLVELNDVIYPPQECAHQRPQRPHGQIINVGETFKNGSIRLVRDIPVGTPLWKRLYHRARNAAEYRNAVLEGWGLKRVSVYGQPRNRTLTALADVWLNLTSLARLVREAAAASCAQQR